MARRTSNGPLLDRRARNRALLARQHLLERTRMPVPGMVEHLVGMQAQSPPAPYVGLQARLEDFRPDQLADLLLDRSMVRGSLMRCTLHLTTASDYLELRPLVQIVLERGFHTGSPFARQLTGVDVGELLDAGRALVDEQPRTRAELRELLAPRWPGRDQDSLAYALSYLLPLVQVPPRGIWGKAGQARLTTVEAWTGQPLGSKLTLDDLVLRYLAAFGPASVADIQTWSWLTRLREVVERLRPGLEVFTDEAGRELFDLPGAPRPDPGTRLRPGSCPSTTTSCSPTPSATTSSPASTASRCSPRARSWSTGSPGGRGRSARGAPASRSSCSRPSARPRPTPSWPRATGSWTSPPQVRTAGLS